jgi:hypothetical protein
LLRNPGNQLPGPPAGKTLSPLPISMFGSKLQNKTAVKKK